MLAGAGSTGVLKKLAIENLKFGEISDIIKMLE